MSFNFNNNNKPGDLNTLTKHQQLSYKPLENEIKNTFYPDFPKILAPKDIIELLSLNIFEPTKLKELLNKQSIIIDYNTILNILQSDNLSFDKTKEFDTFFLFVCNKDIDELLFKEIPYLIREKKVEDTSNIYKLIQLPKGSFFTLNTDKVNIHMEFFFSNTTLKINKL